MDKSRFTYYNPEQNMVIKRIIDESAWSIGMLKEFVFEGEYLRKYLLSDKIFDWRVIRDLSWALRCPPEKLTGKYPGAGSYYSTQPVYPAIMTYTSNNVPFYYLSRQEIADYAHIIGVPAYIIEYMRDGDTPLYCTERFAKLFAKRFNSACPAGSDIPLEYFFSKVPQQAQKKTESNNSNYLTSFIKSIEDSDLSGPDLMKLARYCELEAKKKELLSSINN